MRVREVPGMAKRLTPYSLEYEPGLKRDLANIFSQMVGRENALTGDKLAELLNWRQRPEGASGLKNFKRIMRNCISDMRLEGWLICATGGETGGYWVAGEWSELSEFLSSEFHNKALDMLQKEKIMEDHGIRQLGPKPSKQMALF